MRPLEIIILLTPQFTSMLTAARMNVQTGSVIAHRTVCQLVRPHEPNSGTIARLIVSMLVSLFSMIARSQRSCEGRRLLGATDRFHRSSMIDS